MKANNNLKAVGASDTELRVANYIVLFGGADATGESFSAKTMLESAYTKSSVLHVDFEHGLDVDDLGMGHHEVLGYVDWKTAKVDEKGVFVERVLNRQAKYMEYIEPLLEAGLVGNSSEAIQGKTVRDGSNIVEWPLMRDTLTLTPAEPRMLGENVMQAYKSLQKVIDSSDIKSASSLKDVESFLRQKGLTQAEATASVTAVKRIHGERENEIKGDDLEDLKNWKLS